MLVIGGLGVACVAWAVVSGLRQRPEIAPPPAKRAYVPPSNEDDVDRMVAALQRTSSHDDGRRRILGTDQN
jgi:hypothetical protein